MHEADPDGEIRWKDKDKYDHDTTSFVGSYTLAGTEEQLTVIGHGDSTAHYDAYRGSPTSTALTLLAGNLP
jgi:hypothetical protein